MQKAIEIKRVPFSNRAELSSFLIALSNQACNQAIEIMQNELHDKVMVVFNILSDPKKRAEILESLGLTNQTKNREKYLDPLLNLGWIELTIPGKPTHQVQKYKRSNQAEILCKLLSATK